MFRLKCELRNTLSIVVKQFSIYKMTWSGKPVCLFQIKKVFEEIDFSVRTQQKLQIILNRGRQPLVVDVLGGCEQQEGLKMWRH